MRQGPRLKITSIVLRFAARHPNAARAARFPIAIPGPQDGLSVRGTDAVCSGAMMGFARLCRGQPILRRYVIQECYAAPRRCENSVSADVMNSSNAARPLSLILRAR